ncbi:protein of unknown function [Cardinium endosymbiont cEper1 of Encarsia pergandiella]|nr:protein of unknown function [Cardinium endosymbiont cEper1 of Encarsia pergandiella]
MGLTGIDGKIKSNVSMRGVVSITSSIKLTQSVNGNLAVINNSRRCKFVALRKEEEEDDELRMAA